MFKFSQVTSFFNKFPKISIKGYAVRWPAVIVVAVLFFGIVVWAVKREITIRPEPGPHASEVMGDVKDEYGIGPLTGSACAHPDRRPVAIMLSSDVETRPLSGIAHADVVFEMVVTPPDTTVGVTRLLAIFQCEDPEEIGSIRSARLDFIPLAAAFDPVYVHWGGERDALTQLGNNSLDNIDAFEYEEETFYRKSDVPRPHNGFTTLPLIMRKAQDLGYSLEHSGVSFAHGEPSDDAGPVNILSEKLTVTTSYQPPFDVEWRYDRNTKRYERYRNGTPEIDTLTDEQVSASSVVIMKSTWFHVRRWYIRVRTEGEGDAVVYQNGKAISGSWKNQGGRLQFFDGVGEEIRFVPGKKWVEVDF